MIDFGKEMGQHPRWALAGEIVGSLLFAVARGFALGFAAGVGIVLALKIVGIQSIC